MHQSFVPRYKLAFCLAFAMLAFVLLSASSSGVQAAQISPLPGRTAAVLQPDSPYAVYLPAVIRDPDQPRLIAPANGAAPNTLIPTLSWTMGEQPPDTVVCLALGTSPQPEGCEYTIWYNVDYPDLSEMPWENLNPNTVYYWRVGAIYNEDYGHPKWSEEWSFKTGSRGTILSAPALKTPANNALMPVDQLIFTWSPVNGAVEYSVWVYSVSEGNFRVFFVSSTSLDVRGMTYLFTANEPYLWFVEARNDYAWGNDSAVRQFTALSASYPTTSALPRPTVIFHSPLGDWSGWNLQP